MVEVSMDFQAINYSNNVVEAWFVVYNRYYDNFQETKAVQDNQNNVAKVNGVVKIIIVFISYKVTTFLYAL